jgi:hypothetical protein
LSWYADARAALACRANADGVRLREYACTLLLAVVDGAGAAYAQLGDGAIVVGDGEKYSPVFWPKAGEYANTTFFLTGEDYAEHVEMSAAEGVPKDVALFTDGLQPLVLHNETRSAHAPFFRKVFDTLAGHPNHEELQGPLENSLDSPDVNGLTDDDKTLILATNRPFSHATAEPTVRQPVAPDPAG